MQSRDEGFVRKAEISQYMKLLNMLSDLLKAFPFGFRRRTGYGLPKG